MYRSPSGKRSRQRSAFLVLTATLLLVACSDSENAGGAAPEPADPVVEVDNANGVSSEPITGNVPEVVVEDSHAVDDGIAIPDPEAAAGAADVTRVEVSDAPPANPESVPDIAAGEEESPGLAAAVDADEVDALAAEAPVDDPAAPAEADLAVAVAESDADPEVSFDAANEPIVTEEPESPADSEPFEAIGTPATDPVPDDDGAVEANNEPGEIGLPDFVSDPPALEGVTLARLSNGNVDDGRTFAQRCVGCHSFRDGGQGPDGPQLGPILYGIVGRVIGNQDGFDYSPVFELMNETGTRWSATMLDAFLTAPSEAAHGTAMNYAVPDSEDRADVIAYLRTLADDPLPLDANPEEAAAAHSDTARLQQRIAGASVDEGREIAARCSGCHRFDPDATPLTGPNLYDFVGGPVAAIEGFAYSNALHQLADEGAVWSYARLDAFLENPAIAVPGTRMGFGGIADPIDRAALIAYLGTLAPDPFPLDLDAAVEDENEGMRGGRDDLDPLAFSITQAIYGDRYYSEFGCEDCHGSRLQGVIDLREDGIGVPPALVGPNFERRWFEGNVYALYQVLSSTMPPDGAGGLDELFYADLLAYILRENGFEASTTVLPVDRETLEAMGFYQ